MYVESWNADIFGDNKKARKHAKAGRWAALKINGDNVELVLGRGWTRVGFWEIVAERLNNDQEFHNKMVELDK